MGGRRILVLNGHPDPDPARFAAALAGAYVRGASAAGRQIRRIDVGKLAPPPVRTRAEFEGGQPPEEILQAQEAIAWADHLVIIFPLWLGTMPAALKAFFEQTFRYGFAISRPGEPVRRLLKGRTARIIVTMGMPRPIFRWVFGAHGLKCLERGILWMAGVSPARSLILGGVEQSAERRADWLDQVEALGEAGA
ncbi:putative NADPH-quinone reductase [Caulobacter ginsengisoli]|uniref:NADPH-quinone reductase n=1 Tax=Caulobacter ginsengisoli TaxID=400775 RepID=A0ABU0IXA6_9CAUL|nr:NAD(P)H-dependent oxidoreductase [Caulobacter ginsengisoli]MDQ0465976.1 putative NADPH-quinone reductase [Caulobacter ginsengisoli]